LLAHSGPSLDPEAQTSQLLGGEFQLSVEGLLDDRVGIRHAQELFEWNGRSDLGALVI
jgi:hypothetical protein